MNQNSMKAVVQMKNYRPLTMKTKAHDTTLTVGEVNTLLADAVEDIKQDCRTYRDAQRCDSDALSEAYDRFFMNVARALQNTPQLHRELLQDLETMGKI